MKCTFNNNDVVLSQPFEGPLAEHIAGFAEWACEQGYARYSRYWQVLLAPCFSRWIGQQAVSVRLLSSEHAARYLRFRARHVQIHRGDAAALGQFVGLLRRQGVVPAEKTPSRRLTPIEQAVDRFARYLRNERLLSEAAVVNYVPFVRRFLADRFGDRPVRLSRLCAGDIVRLDRKSTRLN